MDIKTRVLRFRGATGMSQVEMARACGVHPNTILKIERGGHIRQVTEEKIKAFLEANNG